MGHCFCLSAEQADEHQQFVEPFSSDLDLNQRVGLTTVLLEHGVKYTGQWKGDKRDGEGVQFWPDGARFDGQWRDGLAEGFGKFVHADGDNYEGQWHEDKANGSGVLVQLDARDDVFATNSLSETPTSTTP